jgi:hypothetical protein
MDLDAPSNEAAPAATTTTAKKPKFTAATASSIWVSACYFIASAGSFAFSGSSRVKPWATPFHALLLFVHYAP